ncbi:hypothetical protein PoB_000916700 [Plakobranchus ocellatus]|uniref:Uncharacterized protein n=1 Tax=Plakobranchus ocellatus TaxID=259542 RepID=A0AAV3YJU9_9GAST|nr:hypothetical protein PoB_000916700 [Plakobranchus ocellatus]
MKKKLWKFIFIQEGIKWNREINPPPLDESSRVTCAAADHNGDTESQADTCDDYCLHDGGTELTEGVAAVKAVAVVAHQSL